MDNTTYCTIRRGDGTIVEIDLPAHSAEARGLVAAATGARQASIDREVKLEQARDLGTFIAKWNPEGARALAIEAGLLEPKPADLERRLPMHIDDPDELPARSRPHAGLRMMLPREHYMSREELGAHQRAERERRNGGQ